jgi:hypothetical protein
VSQSAAFDSVPSEGEQAGTGESAEALALRPHKEDAMCHSRYWEAEEAKRKQQEAKDREAHAKRSETIEGLRADAHKQAQKAPEQPWLQPSFPNHGSAARIAPSGSGHANEVPK